MVGYEGLYEVSSLGRVRSLDRWVNNGSPSGQVKKGRIRKVSQDPNGYYTVGLSRAGRGVTTHIHRMLAEAFIPNPETLPYVRHLNDVKTDNRLENLAWGTPSDNLYDAVRNGTFRNANTGKTHCKRGHALSGGNVRTTSRGTRECVTCQRAHRKRLQLGYAQQGLPDPEDARHGTVSGYSLYRCRCAPCLEAKRSSDAVSARRRAAQGLPEDDPRHGRYSCYKTWGCRCDKCRKANADYEKERKRRKSEQS